jgi:hypothetical protein
MRSNIFTIAVLIAVAAAMVAAGQESSTDAQKYIGAWAGSYTTDAGVTNKVSFTLKKDEKAQWGGTVKWANQEGEQSADFKSLQITGGKMKGIVESPDGQVDIAIDGHLEGDNLEGTYAVTPKGATEAVERGTWKVTKQRAAAA